MTLITLDELARGACVAVFGGLAGVCTLAFSGSPLWLVPAGVAVGGCALTVAEVRAELRRTVPMLTSGAQRARAALPRVAWALPGIRADQRPQRPTAAQRGAPAPASDNQPELITTLEEQPHRLIIGHTRGGKTTLIHEMATGWARRGERVLVGDPDAAPGLWPGCEVRGYGDDVQSIGELLNVVQAEVEGRRLARAQGVRRFEPLHLVIDEAQDVLPILDGGLELFEDVARRGGKLNIRMTVGVQDKQVKTLGLEGKSALLRNFQVADVMKTRDGRRVAVLRDPETGEKVSMPIPQLTDPETLITLRPATETTQNLRRPAHAPAAAPADDLLATLLAAPVSSASESVSHTSAVSVSVSDPLVADTDTGGVSSASQTLVAPAGGATVRIDVHARAESAAPAPVTPPGRRRKSGGINVGRRRQMAEARRAEERKAALQAAYAERKAAGLSYRKAYAELGGSAEDTRAWWRDAPGPRGT